MSELERLPALLSFGCLAARVPEVEAQRALGQFDPASAATLFRRHKVRVLVDRRLQSTRTSLAAVRAALTPLAVQVIRRVRLSSRVVDEVDRAAREEGIALLGIKGLAARTWYADPGIRDLGDWDLYVDSDRDAWALAGWLRRRGYTYTEEELPWFKRDLESGGLYGQIRLQRQHEGLPVFLDIHFGGYSVRHCGLFRLDIRGARPGMQLIAREQNLVLGVANAGGDDFITVKDLNDLYLAFRDAAVDWQQVRAGVRDAGLEGFFNGMLARLEELFELDAGARHRVAAARFARTSEPLPSLWEQNPRLRRAVTWRHAYAYGRRHSLLRGLVAGLTAARYYGADLRPRLVRRQRPARMPRLNQWTCIRMVPIELATRLLDQGALPAGATTRPQTMPEALSATDAIIRVRTTAGDMVRAGEDLFVPTVYFKLSEDLVQAGAALARPS